MEYLGRKLRKEFKGHGVYLGTVKSYDELQGFFNVVYEDGDSEEMDLAEITSLLGGGNAAVEAVEKQMGVTESTGKVLASGSRNVGRKPRKRRRVGMGVDALTASGNNDVDICDNVGESKLNLDLNDEVVGLDLNKELDLEANGNGVDPEEGLRNRSEFIDLNVDANENEMSKEEGILETSIEKKDRGFDLNLGLEDEIRSSDAVCDAKLKDHIVGDSGKGEVNLGIETLQSGVSPGNVQEETPVKQQNGESLGNDMSRNNLVDVEMEGPSNDGVTGVDKENENVGSSGIRRRGRKRKNVVNGTGAATTTMETSLRRSSRRARIATSSVGDLVSNTLGAVDDSPAVSGVSEEKVKMLVPEKSEKQAVLPPRPQVELPPSSECLNMEGLPVLDVFSIYAFLRSFSMSLFLSPFEFEDFVSSVKCNAPSLLFDSIHVSLLQTLRKHLESLSDESLASASACDCLRSLNWDFLDLITWPIFMNEYLLIHSCGLQNGFNLRRLKLAGSDYYNQPTSLKIEALQCLCDDVMEVEAIRSELNRRAQAIELNADFDRCKKFNGSKKRRVTGDAGGSSSLIEEEVDEATDMNSDECCLCKMEGSLICCDGCPAAFHARCVGVASGLLPEGDWYCPECLIDKNKPWLKLGKSIRGAELFATDPYDRLYYSTCDYLLVLESGDVESQLKYYHRNDLPSVIEALESSTIHHNISTAIREHWHISSTGGGLKSDHDSQPSPPIPESHVKRRRPTRHAPLLAPSGTCAKDHVKPDEIPISSTHPDPIKHGISEIVNMETETINHCVKMECQLASSEGLPENCHAVTDAQGASGLDCSNNFSGSLGDSNVLEKSHNVGNGPLKSSTSGKKISSAPSALSPSMISTKLIMSQGHGMSGYMNSYSFARTASSVFEELTQKSSDKMSEGAIRTVEEIISAQLKIISSYFPEFCWSNIQNTNIDARKENCGWCFACKFPEYERVCFFVMNDKGPAPKSYSGDVLGVPLTKNREGHFIDVMCHILCIEERLQGLLSGPWLTPHYSKQWHQIVLGASDIAALKNVLLTLELNLRHRALSADWQKPVDTVLTIGSARYVITRNQRMSSKQGTGKKKSRYTEPEATPSSNGKGGPGLFWWRGGSLSRELFNWKVLPKSLARKAARHAGYMKIPGLLYTENSESVRRSKCIVWRAAVEMSSSVEQLALQVRELNANIRWDDIENTNILKNTDKGSIKSFRSFKKVIIRRKSLESSVAKYLLDFGKRRFIPDVVLKHGTLVEDSSNERKKYWLEETHVPLHLLKLFEEKRIARKSNKMSVGKLQESRRMMKKPFKKKGFSYLFSKADKLDSYQCGHCNKDVLIREAVSCQYCEGFFHKRHVRKSSGAITVGCLYSCHKCQDGTARRLDTKIKSELPKNQKAAKVFRPLPSKTRKQGRGRKPRKSEDNQKLQYVVPLRRSARTCVKLQNKKVKGSKKAKQPTKSGKVTLKKSKKSTLKKSKKSALKKSEESTLKRSKKGTLKRKRTQLCYSYWLNGLRLSRKPNDERVMSFRSKNLILISEESAAPSDQPNCSLCGEVEFNRMINYIACELCGEWFHGDAFDLRADNIDNVIGCKCHKCRSRKPPVCPHLHAIKRGISKSVNSNNELDIEDTDEQPNDQALLNEGSEEPKSQLKEECMDLSLTNPDLKADMENGHLVICSKQESAGSGNLQEDQESIQEDMVSKDNTSLGDDAVESNEGHQNVTTGAGTELTGPDNLREDQESTQEIMVSKDNTSIGDDALESEGHQKGASGVGTELTKPDKLREDQESMHEEMESKDDTLLGDVTVESNEGHLNITTGVGTESTRSDNSRENQASTQEVMVSKQNTSFGNDSVESNTGYPNVTSGIGTKSTGSDTVKEDQESIQDVMMSKDNNTSLGDDVALSNEGHENGIITGVGTESPSSKASIDDLDIDVPSTNE